MTELEKQQAELITQQANLIKEQAEEIRLLREKVDLLIRKLFGQKSEQLDPAQLELLLDPEKAKKPEETAGDDEPAVEDLNVIDFKKAKRKERKQRLPEHLPTEDSVLDPEPVKASPQNYRCIGQEISEQLDYHPGRFTRKRLIRRKYVHRSNSSQAPIIAPLPNSLQEGCLASSNLIAEIIVNKYAYHLPFYRQEQLFKQRHRVEISRQNMINWEALACDWLSPLYHHIRRSLLSSEVLQADETCIKYIKPGSGRAQHGYLWAYRNSHGVQLFDWQQGRSHSCLEKVLLADREAKCQGLTDFNNTLQSDGYGAYDTYRRKNAPDLTLAACWAHARRKFDEAKSTNPRLIGWILRQIGLLYRIESQLRDTRAGSALRQAYRQSESRLIYQRIGKALHRLKPRILPKSLFGKAISYTLNLWLKLGVFIENGTVEIDNNLTENAIRPTAIGKKNWLFFGSPGSGWKAALIYTLIGNCKQHGIDPHRYISDVLTSLPHMTNHQVPNLLPAAWAKEQKQIAKTAS